MSTVVQPIKPAFFLGANINDPKVLGSKVQQIIDAINNLTTNWNYPVHITDTTQSTSTATGALIVDGGVGIVKNVFIGGTLDVTGISTFANGTVALPSIAFTSDTDSGIYRIGANNLGVGVAGAKVLDISATGLGVVGTVLNGDGAVATPAFSFTSDPDTGMYRIGVNQLGFAANGVLQAMASTNGWYTDTLNERTSGVGITAANIINEKTTAAVTAFATGGQASATALTSQINLVTICATAGDSVKLPTPIVGMRIWVKIASSAAASCDIFPTTGATIGLLAANSAIRVAPGGSILFEATSTTAWHISEFKGGAVIGLTAFAGGGQASAVLIPDSHGTIGTCATAGDSLKLPLIAYLGQEITIKNEGATAADIFPSTGGTIDGGAANAAVRLQKGQIVSFKAVSSTAWISNNTASGTVSQGTSITTGVTLNALKGVITTQSASAAAGAAHTFTVTNSTVVGTSHVSAYIMDYSGIITTNGLPAVIVDNRTAGTFDIIVYNAHGANALSGTLVIGFEVKN